MCRKAAYSTDMVCVSTDDVEVITADSAVGKGSMCILVSYHLKAEGSCV